MTPRRWRRAAVVTSLSRTVRARCSPRCANIWRNSDYGAMSRSRLRGCGTTSGSAGWASTMDVAEWLQGLGLAQYAAAFVENDIDFTLLGKLTDADLKDLG